MSSYVLARVLPPAQERFAEILRALRSEGDRRFALAELNDFLAALTPLELAEAVEHADLEPLSPFSRCYVAAMVEMAAHDKGVSPPRWVGSVGPLQEPWFASKLESLRLHLLASSPVPFKRRNLFVDSTVGGRV